jgi:general secretion pathway protein B
MSFILDALKKAESERSRNSGPVLMEARLARTRQRLPGWAWVLGCILLANLVVLAWSLLRTPPTEQPAVAAPATSVPPIATPIAPVPATIAPEQLPIPAAAGTPSSTPAPQDTGIPTMQDLLAAAVPLPPLQLNLHVYDEASANRYVLLNAKRVREGDEVTDGIRVQQITPRGVVLDFRGRRFLLLAGS